MDCRTSRVFFKALTERKEMKNALFEFKECPLPPPKSFCRTCKHRQRWHYRSGRVIQYCGVCKSNKTDNGRLKIKCKTPACFLYEEEK